jgi:hypothetical protein
MNFTLRDAVIESGIMIAVVLVIAYLGPFGSWELGGFEDRLIYWGKLILVGYLLLRPAMAFAPRIAEATRLPALPVWLGVALVFAVPFTLVVWFAHGAGRFPTAREMLAQYPSVAVIGVLVTLLFWTLRARPVAADAAQAAAAITRRIAEPHEMTTSPPSGPRLLARLPAHVAGPVIAVEMEDHYARVHTARGSALLLMRMRDAVAELDGADGAQVHRSWWVARDAVEAVQPDGRNVRLQLVGGLTAPVARGQVAVLREAGWPL